MREALGSLLDEFEASLETRDKDTIARHREELERFLTLFGPSADDPNRETE